MDRGHLFRRLFHLCGPLILLFYILPSRMFNISKEAWLVAGLALLLVLEAVRLLRGKVFFGLREYESHQISAYAWAGMGVTIAMLIFPMVLAVCAVFGLCWVDPLIGEMRRRKLLKWYPAIPILAYVAISSVALILLTKMGWIAVFALAIIGGLSAIWIERQRSIPIDDDFLMLVLPLTLMTLTHQYLTMTGLISV